MKLKNMYFEIKKSQNGKFFVVLKAANHEPLVNSEMYESKDSAMHLVEIMKKGVAEASVKDLAQE